MNKFDSFTNEELVVLTNSLVGEADMYRDMVSNGISHAGGILEVITGLAGELLKEIGDRKATTLAEIDQLTMELIDSED